MLEPGHVGQSTCPVCGAVWEYDEGYRVDPAWVRQLYEKTKTADADARQKGP